MPLFVEVKVSLCEQKNIHTYLTSDRTEDPQSEDPESYPMMTGPLNNDWSIHTISSKVKLPRCLINHLVMKVHARWKQTSMHSYTFVQDEGGMSASCSGMFSPGTHWIRGLGGTRISPDAMDRWKNSLLLSRNYLCVLCHPACSPVTVQTELLPIARHLNIRHIRDSEQCVPAAGLSRSCISCNTANITHDHAWQ